MISEVIVFDNSWRYGVAMFAAERRQRIAELVRSNGAMSIRDLAEHVRSSEVTVRRDLRTLEEAGLLRRQHGGALAREDGTREPTYAEKAHTASTEKAAIARAAAAYVRDGDAIVIGAGTTTMALAAELRDRTELTVMTNSLLVAQVFADSPRIEVVLTGGMLRGTILALVGSVAERSLAGLHTDRTFLSGNGITPDNGLSTPNQLVASIDKALAAAGREVVVLADYTKFEKNSVVQTVPTSQIDRLITDGRAPADDLDRFRGAGVVVEVAPL